MHIPSSKIVSLVNRAFEDPESPELVWETTSNKMSARWTTRTPEGDRYTIAMRGVRDGAYVLPSLANVTFKERGTPYRARGKRIASADTFELAVVCALHHYWRLSNGRKTAARNEAAGRAGSTK